jgi:hypothetical protein
MTGGVAGKMPLILGVERSVIPAGDSPRHHPHRTAVRRFLLALNPAPAVLVPVLRTGGNTRPNTTPTSSHRGQFHPEDWRCSSTVPVLDRWASGPRPGVPLLLHTTHRPHVLLIPAPPPAGAGGSG